MFYSKDKRNIVLVNQKGDKNMDESLKCIKTALGDDYFPKDDESSLDIFDKIREITVTKDRPIVFYTEDETLFCDRFTGEFTKNYTDSLITDDKYIDEVIGRLTDNSPYMYEKTISQGYIPYTNGVRVSVLGEGVTDNSDKVSIRNISTLSFRVSRVISDASKDCIDYIHNKNDVYNTLIISPPGCGKTTILRDIAYKLSHKFRVGIADERNEISVGDMGLYSMVISGIPKKNAFETFVRNACADVIVCDEIGGDNDAQLVFETMRRGVKIITTIHGENYDDILINPLSKNLYSFFDTLVFLQPFKGKGLIKEIYFKGEKR